MQTDLTQALDRSLKPTGRTGYEKNMNIVVFLR